MANLGDDAKMLIRRAKKHYAEFRRYRDGRVMGEMWAIRHRPVEDGFSYRLVLNRSLFIEMKPVVADIANNIIHSLDLLVGELARANGGERNFDTKFPWLENEADFQGALKGLSKVIGTEACEAIDRVRQKWAPQHKHIHALKTVSNRGKHWELVPTTAGAAAIVWVQRGPDRIIWELPKDAFEGRDEYQLPTVPQVLTGHCQIVMSFKLAGLGEGFDPTPETVIDYAMRYAEEVIVAVEALPPAK